MPPKSIITEKDILKAAFDIVRKKSFEHLSARNIAKKLNCSTQPIYSIYKNMKNFEEKLIQYIKEFVIINYLLPNSEERQFFNIGMGYIMLAKKDRELYKILFISGKMELDFDNELYPINNIQLIEIMKKDPSLKNLEEYQLKRMLKNMWIYTHGITSFIYAYPDSISDEMIYKTVNEMGFIVIQWEHLEGKNHF